NAGTRVWKGGKPAQIADIAVDDALLANLTAELPGSPSRCTEIWIGAETQKLVAEEQAKKHRPAKK
ncbi:MAG: hypothetical protein ABI318_13625, partial [Chthoniobacteraceae bacterium]